MWVTKRPPPLLGIGFRVMFCCGTAWSLWAAAGVGIRAGPLYRGPTHGPWRGGPGPRLRGRRSTPLARRRTAEPRSAKFRVSCWHRAPRGGVRPLPSHLFHNWQIVEPTTSQCQSSAGSGPATASSGLRAWRRPLAQALGAGLRPRKMSKNTRARLWGGHAPVLLGWNLGFSVRPRPMRRAREFPPMATQTQRPTHRAQSQLTMSTTSCFSTCCTWVS